MNTQKNRAGDDAKPETPTACVSASAGAEPCTTAPAKRKKGKFQLIRQGTDTLEISHSGRILEEVEAHLAGLKLMAQSDDETERAKAQIEINGILFAVHGQGAGGFAICMDNGHCRCQFSSSRSSKLPLAYTQFYSACLVTQGVEEATRELDEIVRQVGHVEKEAQVS